MPFVDAATRIRPLGFLLLALVVPPRAAAAEGGLRAVYDRTETTVSAPGASAPGEKVTRATFTARLAPAALAVREGDGETVYDFAARRVVRLDHAKKESRESSLHAIPAFAERELENRKVMARMMAAIGRAPDPADVEAELRMTMDPPAKVRLEQERRNGARVLTLNGRDVTWFVAHEAALPPQLVPALSRLLLYEARLHPRVRAELLKDGRLPRRLEFRWQQIGEQTTVVWDLREAVEEPLDLADAGASYASRPLEEQGLLELAWRVRAGRAGASPAGAAYRERAERLLAEGRGFEAFLVAVEASFATGETPEDLLGRARDAAGSDPRMRAASRALELEQRDPKGALAQLETLDPTGLEGGDAIHVLRANDRIRLGQGGEALKEFTRALTANPFLLGPWIDAGKLYQDSYRMASAWACWEAARAIAPGHPLLKRVNDLEASLRKRHPEYF